MLPAVAGLFLALLAVLLVLEPLLRAARGERIVNAPSLLVDDDEDDDPMGDRKGRALIALREIEFDQATGKLSDEDYQRLYERYAAEAMAAMREDDGPTDRRTDVADPSVRQSVGPSDAIENLIRAARTATRPGARKFCEECGAKLEGSGRFCVECGIATAV